jgi:trk system potassium uptake protein TrkA
VKIIICGAGKIGQSLVHHLFSDHELVVIDHKRRILDSLTVDYDIQVLQGSCLNPHILIRAGLSKGTALVAVTDNDEVNLLCCQIGKFIFNADICAVRLKEESYFHKEWKEIILERFGIDVVLRPEKDATVSILQSFDVPYAFDTDIFADNKLRLIGFQVDKRGFFLGKSLKEITSMTEPLIFKVVMLIRNYSSFLPKDEEVLLFGDALYCLIEDKDTSLLLERLGYYKNHLSPVVIFGISAVSRCLLEKISSRPVIVIEENLERIKEVAPLMPRVQFMQGSPLDPELLKEAHIDQAAYVIAVTNDDTTNILAALMSHRCGVAHSIALVQRIGSLSPLFALGIEKMVRPSQLLMTRLLRKLTKEHIVAFHPLEGDNSGAFIEAVVYENSRALGMKAKDINSEFIQVLGVMRKDELVWDSLIVQLGDHVLMAVLPDGYPRFQKLFG